MKNLIAGVIILILFFGGLYAFETEARSLKAVRADLAAAMVREQKLEHNVASWQEAGETCSAAIAKAKKETQ